MSDIGGRPYTSADERLAKLAERDMEMIHTHRLALVHMSLGAKTWCGKPGGFHHATRETSDVERVTCPRCIKAYGAYLRRVGDRPVSDEQQQ